MMDITSLLPKRRKTWEVGCVGTVLVLRQSCLQYLNHQHPDRNGLRVRHNVPCGLVTLPQITLIFDPRTSLCAR